MSKVESLTVDTRASLYFHFPSFRPVPYELRLVYNEVATKLRKSLELLQSGDFIQCCTFYSVGCIAWNLLGACYVVLEASPSRRSHRRYPRSHPRREGR